MKYLSLLNLFYQDGISEIVRPVQDSVQHAIGSISLKEKLKIKDLKSIFDKVKLNMAFSLSATNSHPGRYLIRPEDIERLNQQSEEDDTKTQSNVAPLTTAELEVLKKMMNETQDILESADFRRVLDSSIDVGFSLVMDTLISCYVTGENGFNNPNEVEIPLAKLLPLIKQVYDDRDVRDEQLALVRHLLCLDILNCFAANIYEAFCEPSADDK
jgi:hypothetical protein